MVAERWFSNDFISSTLIIWHSIIKKCLLLPLICVSIYVFLSVWAHGWPFFKWVIIWYYHYLFWCSDCLQFGQWELLQIGYFLYFPSFIYFYLLKKICLFIFLAASGLSRTGLHYFWALLYVLVQWDFTDLSCTSPALGMSQFSKELWLLLVGNGI